MRFKWFPFLGDTGYTQQKEQEGYAAGHLYLKNKQGRQSTPSWSQKKNCLLNKKQKAKYGKKKKKWVQRTETYVGSSSPKNL